MKRLLISTIVVLVLLFAFHSVEAQVITTSTDRALYNLKESVSVLVTAKDKNDKNSLAYRIVAFKQVIDLSLAESEEVRTKLASFVPLSLEKEWHDRVLEELSVAIQYFKLQRKSFNGLQIKSTDEIKLVAEKFKTWREENYIPVIEAATDYIALKEVSNALSIADARRQKIAVDLDAVPILGSPSRARVLGELSNLLLKSRDMIATGIAGEKQAYALFSSRYLVPNSTSSTSTLSGASNSPMSTSTASSTSSTSTESIPLPTATTTSSTIVTAPTPILSIKDLVRSSLTNVQETYRIFIEMSRVVRTLL